MDPATQARLAHLISQLIALAHEAGLTLALGTTLPDPPPQPKEHVPAAPQPVLDDAERAALDAADGKPRTVKALAKLAGYAPSGHFRSAVGRLVDRGLLRRVRGGVLRPAA